MYLEYKPKPKEIGNPVRLGVWTKKYTTSSINFQLFGNRKLMNVKFKFNHFQTKAE